MKPEKTSRNGLARHGVEKPGDVWWNLSAPDLYERAIRQGGSSISDFVDGEGRAGYFQVTFSVYDREGLPCPRCATPVRRLVQAGRSTFYCPGCQT